MLRFAGQIIRDFSAFAPCLEHVCAGGGSVGNAGLMIHDDVGMHSVSTGDSFRKSGTDCPRSGSRL